MIHIRSPSSRISLLALSILIFSVPSRSEDSRTADPSDERTFGDCILDPEASGLQEQWKIFFERRKKRAQVTTRVLPKRLPMPEAAREIIESVLTIEPLLNTIRKIETRFLKKAFQDKHFNLLISDPAFMERIRSGAAQEQIRNSDLEFKDDPEFLALLAEIESQLAKPGVPEAIEIFRKNDLGILDPLYRKSALSALAFLNKKKATLDLIRSWKNSPPLLSDVPLPPSSLGIFAVRYRLILSRSVTEFIEDFEPEWEDARLVFKKLTPEEWESIRHSEPPTEANAFDQHVLAPALLHRDAHRAYLYTPDQYGAIDGIARTLWGEASSCQVQGYAQFEAISKIIAERALSIERAREETKKLQSRKAEVREKNWTKFLRNWVGIKRSSGELQSDPGLSLRGMADFGRKEMDTLDEAAQVVSRKGQFSVWNSFSRKTFRFVSNHPNIPGSEYRIQGPQSSRDDQALTRILCPEFQNETQRKLWILTESLARDLVLNRRQISTEFQWPSKDQILFYTHEAELPFAREVKLGSLNRGKTKLKINGKGRGPCNRFRLFAPKSGLRF
jgi:hypothetical protein